MIFTAIHRQTFLALSSTQPDYVDRIEPKQIALACAFLAGTNDKPGGLVPTVNLFRVETARLKAELSPNSTVSKNLEHLRHQSAMARSVFSSTASDPTEIEFWGELRSGKLVPELARVLEKMWKSAEVAWRWGVANQLECVAGLGDEFPAPLCFALDCGDAIVPPLNASEWAGLLDALTAIGAAASEMAGSIADEGGGDADEAEGPDGCESDLVDVES